MVAKNIDQIIQSTKDEMLRLENNIKDLKIFLGSLKKLDKKKSHQKLSAHPVIMTEVPNLESEYVISPSGKTVFVTNTKNKVFHYSKDKHGKLKEL